MDSTKNFFDAWMNTQSKFVDNLMDTSKKIQESLNQGEVIERSVDLYNEWFENQKDLADTILTTLNNQNDREKASDFFKNWIESQMELGKKWMTFLNYAAGKESNDKSLESYANHMQKLYTDWNGVYNHLITQYSQPMNGLDIMKGNFNANGITQFIDNTRTYMKMFEMWQPIYKMMQSNSMGIDSLTKILDMDKYKEVLDGIFHFMDAEKSKGFVEMIKKYTDLISSSTGMQGMLSRSMHQLQNFAPSTLVDKGLSSLAQLTYEFSEQFGKFINPYFTMIPAGREKEMLALIMEIQDKYAKYYIKGLEMQNMVYTAGQKSIEQAVREIMNKAQEKPELISFDEFYAIWVNTMEEDTIKLFASESYSRLQGDLLKIGLEIKSNLDKLMEYLLAPLPVAARSEIDELNATVYELKSKIRMLEKQLRVSLKEESKA